MDVSTMIAQACIDIMVPFLAGFAVMLVISWMVSLFPGKRDF